MKIFIRLDDISADMDWQRFDAVCSILDKHGVCPLLGVIPDNQDSKLHYNETKEDFGAIIRALMQRGYVVAQHGVHHIYVSKDAGLLGINNRSELSGLSYDEQLNLLSKGQNILRKMDINTDIFMAPAHSFDINTLKALKDLGFSVITDGLHNIPYFREKLLFIPCRLRGFKAKAWDTICLHTNLMSESDIKELDSYLESMGDRISSFDVEAAKISAIDYSGAVKRSEIRAMKMRKMRNQIANSPRLSRYLSYTNHSNPFIKWLMRMFMLPLLLRKNPPL